MTLVLNRAEIERAVAGADLVAAMEAAFVAYSEGRAVVPPVGELLFEDPPGDAHIKYGYLKGDDIFVIKVAAGFYENARKGLPSNTGLVLVFDQKTGLPRAVLLDEGELTNLRTAAAGAVAAKHLAKPDAHVAAILGAGIQARMQLEFLRKVRPVSSVRIWARRPEAAAALVEQLSSSGLTVRQAETPAEAVSGADLIVTATAAHAPLLDADDISPGAHITAMGSDTAEKQEIAAPLTARADVLACDSIAQCAERGEIHHALKAGLIQAEKPIELGALIAGRAQGRTSPTQITLADLTGVAVQDILIAKAVLAATGA